MFFFDKFDKEEMKTYIVNLKKDIERREYISKLLNDADFLDKEFLEAVYGKELSVEQLNSEFDSDLAYKRYGRQLNLGEIGCTLSHFKAYKKLLASEDSRVLLLEDDITIMRDFSRIDGIADRLPEDEPYVLFLSGDYWYKRMRPLEDGLSIADVYDAVGTYAYVINRKGAELIIKKNPKASAVADNWSLYRRQGLKLYAVKPYLIDANIDCFASSIEQSCFGEVRKNMPLSFRLKSYTLSLKKKWLLRRGKFVSKIRK